MAPSVFPHHATRCSLCRGPQPPGRWFPEAAGIITEGRILGHRLRKPVARGFSPQYHRSKRVRVFSLVKI